MLGNINHGWRWLATAFSYLVFGVGGLLLTFFIVPFLYLLLGGEQVRQRRAQSVIHKAFKIYIEMMKGLGVLSYEITNAEKLADAKLILANHPSLIDVVFLISLVPNANCVVKGALTRNPCIRYVIKMAGYIINDESDDLIQSASEAFKKGHALIIFPEGTRTAPSQQVKLKRGAANVAVRADVDITPVLIECSPSTLTKSDRWYDVPSKRVRFRIDVKEPIAVAEYIESHNPSKAARRLTHDLSNYFNKELGLNE